MKDSVKAFFAVSGRILTPVLFMAVGLLFLYASFSLVTASSPPMSSLALNPPPLSSLVFGCLFGILGVAFVTYAAALYAISLGQLTSLKQVYDEIKSFFLSPLFFLLFGVLFLYSAFLLLDQTHSAFTFILAILGIALILFGTGSHAVASANLPVDAAAKINVGIAGGAAALAAIFGYGTMFLETGIQGFFKRSVDYGFLELSTRGSPIPTLDLENSFVSASFADGRPLHIWKRTSEVQIMVPRYLHMQTAGYL